MFTYIPDFLHEHIVYGEFPIVNTLVSSGDRNLIKGGHDSTIIKCSQKY